MNVLIIDDKSDQVQGIADYANEQGWTVKIDNFQEALIEIDDIDPDVVVLDLREDDIQDDMRGKSIFNTIWKRKFRPIIIFSGYAEGFNIQEEAIKELAHEPLFVKYAKGDETPVYEQLRYLADVVPAITRIRERLNIALIHSAEGIAMIKNLTEDVPQPLSDYLFSNRIMHFFSESVDSMNLPAWTQYILPPIGDHLFTGDILHMAEKPIQDNNPENYAVILTPTCDIVKVSDLNNILIAHCCPFSNSNIASNFDNSYTKGSSNYESRKKSMASKMNAGFVSGKAFLPHIRGVIPDLCVDLKQLDLLPVDNILLSKPDDPHEEKWYRIVSLSSPYRERLTWAYMNTTCRPGVPTIDTGKWVDDIFDARN